MNPAAITASSEAPPVPRLDRSRHAAPQVLDFLRKQIIALELPPGSVVSRSEVAANFGLSQTPVRDALIRLAEEGLIEVFAQHKTVVSRIDVGAAKQSHFLRRSIELEIARVIARQPNPELAKSLGLIIDRQQLALDASDYQQFLASDQAFHRQMYEAARVPDLYGIVQRHSGHIDRLRRLHVPLSGKGASIIADHRQIVAAIAGGKSDAATRCVERHLSGTLTWIDTVRAQFPDYVTN